MPFRHHQRFLIEDKSYISLTKRDISKLAESIGFSEYERGKVEIVVIEMATNIVKYSSKGGAILVKETVKKGKVGIEIIALDQGPGMRDVPRMMEDGISTFGSKGEGLGAIKRLADDFEIFSQPGFGTIVLTRLYSKETKSIIPGPAHAPIECQAVMVPKRGETHCGDGFALLTTVDSCWVIAVDGLGHGHDASHAAQEAIKGFNECSGLMPSEILKHIHLTIKKTRGVVGAIAKIEFKAKRLVYCGIGNISGRIVSSNGAKTLASYNGTIGFTIPTIFHDHSYPWEGNPVLILHSDGLKSRWESSRYNELLRKDSTLLAAALYLENTRGTDDSLVLVAKHNIA